MPPYLRFRGGQARWRLLVRCSAPDPDEGSGITNSISIVRMHWSFVARFLPAVEMTLWRKSLISDFKVPKNINNFIL